MSIISTFFSADDNKPLFSMTDITGFDTKHARPGDQQPIRLLVVDDDEDIHQVTKLVLVDYHYQQRPLELLHAYSANHARQLLEQHPDIAVLLLDVVMETEHAGLDLVNYIRGVMDNKRVRIILRTGQPGQAPEMSVIQNYDIHDYREKSELTAAKLISAVTAAIRSYQDIHTIEQLALEKSNLESLVNERTRELQQINQHLDQMVKERTHDLQVAMEQATSASQAKSQFLSRVSHELRTPMNAILGFAQLINMDDEKLADEHRDSVHEILKAGEHLMDLINELIEISRIETGQVQLNYEPVSFCHLANDVITLMRPFANKQDITLVNHALEQGDLTITTDKTRLRQVLINLINNAIKYNHRGGSVSISCQAEERQNRIRIAVTDTGIGIAPENQKMIFQPFLRVDDYSHAEGSGVGLSVCKQIIDVLGGEIGVESKQGEGSTFWFTLPTELATGD
jgi:signal transduction histidine kinase